MIQVTKTFLPDKDKYINYINRIYSSGQITNNGPLLKELEKRLSNYFGVKNLILVANGTIALEIAYRALDIKNYVITTPFSFVATTSSLVSNGLNPIFVDIDKNTLNIDINKIEQSITPNTTAIVAVHVFGNACAVEEIEKIAKKHNLKVIYDGAHTFGVNYNNGSLANFGDITTLSFHATKLFHTIEGGALITNDDKIAQRIKYLINFGIKDKETIPYLGTNAKMNEFEAAMGLCVLDDIDYIFNKRKKVYEIYEKELSDIVKFQSLNNNATKNYSYFPILFKSEEILLKIEKILNDNDIFPRRYFYPSLDTLSYIEPKQYMPISRDISKRIMCLPMYPTLEKDIQYKIINIIKDNI